MNKATVPQTFSQLWYWLHGRRDCQMTRNNGNGPRTDCRWALFPLFPLPSREWAAKVLSCAGIDPKRALFVEGLMDFVGKVIRTSVALSREEVRASHAGATGRSC